MSEPTEVDDIYILLDELNERSNNDIVLDLSIELGISEEESLSYVKQWLFINGE